MEVETARFVLTGYDERDIADTAEMMRDPAVHAFFYGVQARLAEPAEVFADVTRATFLTPFRQEQARTGLGGLAVRTRGTREWVGLTGFFPPNEHRPGLGPELVYVFASAHHGTGAAREAAAKALSLARDRTVSLVCDRPNIASQRLAERLGFVRQGQVAAHGSDDMVLYVRTRDRPEAGE